MFHTAQFVCSAAVHNAIESSSLQHSPSDSHGIDECQCLCQRSKQAGLSISFLGDSRVGFLVISCSNAWALPYIVHVHYALLIDNFFSVVVTDRRSKRSSLLSNHTVNIPTIFADLPAALGRMCTEVTVFCVNHFPVAPDQHLQQEGQQRWSVCSLCDEEGTSLRSPVSNNH